MRGSYNAAANQNAAKNRNEKTRKRCAECDEKKAEIEEKNGVILTLHKKMELLRAELMNQNIEMKTKENKITDLVTSLAKCEYENVKKNEEQLEKFKKEVELKEYELEVTKEELLSYVNRCESTRDELEKTREMMKMESLMQSKELKDINKELVENKLLHERKAELDESQRTVSNLNTMVTDLQYVVKKLLINSTPNADVGSDIEEKIKKCNIRVKKSSKHKSMGSAPAGSAQTEDETLGLARKYLDFTKNSYSLRQRARERVKGNEKVDFVFADVNCNLCLKLMDGSFIHFTTEGELDQILERLNRASTSDSG